MYMEKTWTFIGMMCLAIVGTLINTWGYQVLWENVVLNIWQMFSEADVINTMKIPFGVFLLIDIGKSLIWNPKPTDSTDRLEEAIKIVIPILFTKFITIGLVLLLSAIVF